MLKSIIVGCLILRSKDATDVCGKMIGYKIITKQTGASGASCDAILMTEFVQYSSEIYLAVMLDRESKV